MKKQKQGFISQEIFFGALKDAFLKFHPKRQIKNPVIFVTLLGAIVTTNSAAKTLLSASAVGFEIQITLWLWFTVYFANFSEAGRRSPLIAGRCATVPGIPSSTPISALRLGAAGGTAAPEAVAASLPRNGR